MTTVDVTAPPSLAGAWKTIVRGLRATPEFRIGLRLTVVLTVISTAGRIIIPIAVQQTLDHGFSTRHGVHVTFVAWAVGLSFIALVVTSIAAYYTNFRLYIASETGLAALRVRTFRHVHDLSVLHQAAERRGTLVARVTTDVDQLSQFMQWGGIIIVVAGGQFLVASILMAIYSWQLTLLVYACFLPLAYALRKFQVRLNLAYAVVRERVGDMLGAVAESVVGASVIRAYGVERRTAKRIDTAIDRHMNAAISAQKMSATMYSTGEVVAGIANAAVVVVGVLLGIGGHVSAGRLVAFLFLVTLFVGPVQVATEVLNEAQNAIAGLRRVIGVLDMPTDVADPVDGRELPAGPIRVRFEHVHYAYPGRPEVLTDIDLEIAPRTRIAVVGETGSGKTTFAKLLTRLMDPTKGEVLLSGVPLRQVQFASLRRRVVMVPQDSFLFDGTIAANIRYGRPGISDDEIVHAVKELGLAEWVRGLPGGLSTRVGERGESLSAGERQLVAVARAYVADPDLLVLDEATSAVDPATEVRLHRALENLTRGRTAISIAHRLSTAEAADEVLVFDAGRVVQRGSHATLRAEPGVYANLYASWTAHGHVG